MLLPKPRRMPGAAAASGDGPGSLPACWAAMIADSCQLRASDGACDGGTLPWCTINVTM